MKKNRKNFNFLGFKDKYAKRRTIMLIGVILIVILLRIIIGFIFKEKEPTMISFLLNNEMINLKHEMFLDENEVIYLSKDDVQEMFDGTIYYNEAEKELITTYNKHIALLKVNEEFMIVNDSNIQLKSPMIEKDKVVYLPLSELGIVYDLEIEYSKSNKRVICDSLSKEKNRALALSKFRLKGKPSIFSNKTEKIEQGEYLVVVEKVGNYYKVRSSDGNLGYINKKKLSELEKIRDNWEEEKLDVNILFDASDISKEYDKSKVEKKKTNVVIPKFFFVDNDNSELKVLDKTNSKSDKFIDYVKWVKENNIEIWVTLSNNSEVSNSLRTYTDRNKIINQLYYILVEYEFQGININFEKIDDVNSFNRFIIELTPRLKELGLKVSVSLNNNLDNNKLKGIVDFIIEEE